MKKPIDLETLNQFSDAMDRFFADDKVLVGSEIYDDINKLITQPFGYRTFIKCDILEDRVVVFCERHPLNGFAVTIDDFVSLDKHIQSIDRLVRVFRETNNPNIAVVMNKKLEVVDTIELAKTYYKAPKL